MLRNVPYLYSPPGSGREACLARRFFEANQHRIRSEFSRKTYTVHYKALQERHPEKRGNEFTWEDIQAYIQQGVAGGWKPWTIAGAKTAISSLYKWAAAEGLAPVDFSAKIGQAFYMRKPEAARKAQWLVPDEIRLLLAACDGDDPRALRDRLFLSLAVSTGLRSSEMRNLRWTHVHLARRKVDVIFGKGGKHREAHITASLLALIEKWQATMEEATGADLWSPIFVHPTDPERNRYWPLFPVVRSGWSEGGGHVDPKLRKRESFVVWDRPSSRAGLDQAFRSRARSAGLVRLQKHDLRRSFAKQLDDAEAPVQDIQVALGHESVATTIGYLKHNPKRLEATVEGVDFGL